MPSRKKDAKKTIEEVDEEPSVTLSDAEPEPEEEPKPEEPKTTPPVQDTDITPTTFDVKVERVNTVNGKGGSYTVLGVRALRHSNAGPLKIIGRGQRGDKLKVTVERA